MTPTILSMEKRRLVFGRRSNGILLTPLEFDQAVFQRGWRYELINGVLVVSRIPEEAERDAHEELGAWLRTFAERPEGCEFNTTLPERVVRVGDNRRWVDRAIWIGLGRLPRRSETPTIVVEFVYRGRRCSPYDYVTKRDEYLAAGVKEYWVIDRFDRCLVVFTRQGAKSRQRLTKQNQVYKTPLLPGFELPLAQLLALADAWDAAARERRD